MAPLVATRRVPVIVMHNREAADPDIDIIADVMAFFTRSLEIVARAGFRARVLCLTRASALARRRKRTSFCLADDLRSSGLRACRCSSAPHASVSSIRDALADRTSASGIDCRNIRWQSRSGGGDRARPRRRGNRSGAPRERGNRGRPMNDRIFVRGLAFTPITARPHQPRWGKHSPPSSISKSIWPRLPF